MIDTIHQWLLLLNIRQDVALIIARAVIVLLFIGFSFLVNVVAKKIIVSLIGKLVSMTETTWDNMIFDRGVLTRLSHLAPAIVLYFLGEAAFPEYDILIDIIHRIAVAYMIAVAILVIDSFLSAVNDIYSTFAISRTRPIKGYIQVVKILLYLIGAIIVVTTLLDTSPFGLLSGIGAMSAVLLLVFKDSILGFVSSIQLTANNMVHIGDWIEMPKYSADGEVTEINLQTIKVQNWDKTISTIPVYALVSDSFKNWRGMMESGGRRIKRSVYIDMRSIQFCTDDMLQKFRKIEYLKDFVDTKVKEIERYNETTKLDISEMINGRRLTNIGIFRAYLVAFLKNHPNVHNSMLFIVRQLQTGPQGLPIEIYVFCTDQRWAYYEAIQADIFDHILAIIPEFNLRVYQEPSGWDIKEVAESIKGGQHSV